MKKLLSILIGVNIVLGLQAQVRGNNIVVTVIPDHKDWTYRKGEKISFEVKVLQSSTLLDNVQIDYEMGPELYPDVKKSELLKQGKIIISGKMNKPGFYRLRVKAHVNEKEYEGVCTAAVDPEEIQPQAQCPEDFDTFWSKALEQARWTALEPIMEPLPARSTDKVNTYHVSFQNDKWGRRVYAILNVPKAPGKYPAVLKVPGAGVRPYNGDQWTAAKGCIVLEIGIHGVPVTNPQSYYDELQAGPLDGYFLWSINDRDRNYYKHVITGAIRAIDYIASLPQWDGEHLGVLGSSQGGFLSLACAALDKRVSCYAPVHAAMCDHEASLKRIACGWPHYFYGKENPDPKEVEGARYYDGVNFARRITCPGWFSFGYNDDVVPPTTSWATYNSVSGPKEIHPYQQTAHFWYQEQYDAWIAWILKMLGIS